MSSEYLEWAKVIASISWQILVIAIVLIFKGQIADLLKNITEIAVGNIVFKRRLNELVDQGEQIAEKSQQALNTLGNTTELMAKSRLFELEVFNESFGMHLSEDKRNELISQIDEFKKIYSIQEEK